MEISWLFLGVFTWCYIGFFGVLYDWYLKFNEWNYVVSLLGIIGGPVLAFTLFVPKPSGVWRDKIRQDD